MFGTYLGLHILNILNNLTSFWFLSQEMEKCVCTISFHKNESKITLLISIKCRCVIKHSNRQ